MFNDNTVIKGHSTGKRGHSECRLVLVSGLAFDIGNGSHKQIQIPNVMDLLTVDASN